ncbi:MAG TPA: D-alanyl-D-alanine carboxypeptidase [Microvirga sp.]
MALATIAGVTASIVVGLSSPAEAARRKRGNAGGGYNPPYAAMVVDVKTGRVLHAVNEDAPRFPASVTKVMTLYLLFEQLERGKVSLDTPLHVSANAARQAPSKLFLDAGDTIAVEDAIKALVTKSANDVAVVVAENIGGSVDDFADMMTRKARSLGMSSTTFTNPSGLPDPEQVTTARDLTILARAVQDRFPKYYRYFQTRVFNYAGVGHKNHNKLLGRVEGVDGIKTGFTRASGFNLMTNAKTDDRHIVAVVLGGKSGGSRDQIMAQLVNTTLPRAYAGLRQTPAIGDGAPATRPTQVAEAAPPARPVQVAEAAPAASAPLPLQRQTVQPAPAVETTAAVPSAPQAAPQAAARKPLDLNSLRPVVASASGAGTATPSQPMRLQPNGLALPATAQAYAPVQAEPQPARIVPPAPIPAPVASAPLPPAAPVAKVEDRLPVGHTVVAKAEPVEAKVTETRSAARPSVTGWVIQLGAMDDEDKAKTMLDAAKSKTGRTLARASAFTEKVTKSGSTLYRARFSGFDEAEEAEAACKALKRNGFACFATRS